MPLRIIIAALAAGLAMRPAAAVPPGPTLLPPFASAYTPTSVDERGMWQQADETERVLRDSPAVIRDPALNAYLRDVLCRTVGQDRCQAARIYIVRIPAFNASMAPNGTLIVWTGLLLRVRNEAELAAVLGHEFGHFELRHSLGAFKRARTTSDIMAWATILAPQNSRLPVTLVGMRFAYERADETEADLMGLKYVQAAGYQAAAFPHVLERLMAEQDETARGRKRAVSHRYAAGFFASHPTDLARAAYLREAAGADADRGAERADALRTALLPWRAQLLDDQIKLNDFGGSEYLLGQLAGGDWTPDLLLARAELYRDRGNPRDLVSAAQFYQQAIDGGCTDAGAWRGLGLALLRGGRAEAGRAALATYLQRAPDAPDKAVMAMLIGTGGMK